MNVVEDYIIQYNKSMSKTKTNESEAVIKELNELVVKIDYSESPKTKKAKLDSSKIWTLAKKVGKNLNDDSVPATNAAHS